MSGFFYPILTTGGERLQELLSKAVELLRLMGVGEGLRSVAPVIGILLVFQLVVLRQPLQNWKEIAPSASSSAWSGYASILACRPPRASATSTWSAGTGRRAQRYPR